MASLFGFIQLDFAGALPLADGRYLTREPAPAAGGAPVEAGGAESVLVVHTLGAPAPRPRRRRRPRPSDPAAPPAELPLCRLTVIGASEPLPDPGAASSWLERACEPDAVDDRAAAALALVNRALHAQAVASGDPRPRELTPAQAVAARIGWGSGEETASGRFTEAREVDVRPRTSTRRRREEELGPQQRVAAVLSGRERPHACETLLPRARVDLDAGREREAALQLRAGLEALLAELPGALVDPAHEEDIGALRTRREAVERAAREALAGDPGQEARETVAEALALAERVLRRRRILQL